MTWVGENSRGHTIIELTIAFFLFVSVIAISIGLLRYIFAGSNSITSKSVLATTIKQFEEYLRRDFSSASGCYFSENCRLELSGVVDHQGVPIGKIVYEFDQVKRTIVRRTPTHAKTFNFFELSRRIDKFSFVVSFFDERGKTITISEKAHFIEFRIDLGEITIEKDSLSFRVPRKSTFSAENPGDSLLWNE